MRETTRAVDLEPSVVIAGESRLRDLLAELVSTWGWTVVGHGSDELSGLAEARRTRPDLLIVLGHEHTTSDPSDRIECATGTCRVVHVVDVPQDLTRDPGAFLAGLPAAVLRERLLGALVRQQAESLP